jgi:hypothetical protein
MPSGTGPKAGRELRFSTRTDAIVLAGARHPGHSHMWHALRETSLPIECLSLLRSLAEPVGANPFGLQLHATIVT